MTNNYRLRDIQLLHALQRRINSNCTSGAHDTTTLNIKIRNEQTENACLTQVKKTITIQIASTRANGTLVKLPLGLKLFCKRYNNITKVEFTQMNIGHCKQISKLQYVNTYHM